MICMDKCPLERYKVCLNYQHELIVRYTWAYSGRQAKNYIMRRVANEHGVGYNTVRDMFDGSKPNFTVEKES